MFDNLFDSANPGDVLCDYLDQHYHHRKINGGLTKYDITLTGDKISVKSYEMNPETDRENKKSDYTITLTNIPDEEREITVELSGYVNDERVNKSFTTESFEPVVDYLKKFGEF